MGRLPADVTPHPHHVAGVECSPAPIGWAAAAGALVLALALVVVPECLWQWISRSPRLVRALHLEEE